MMAEMSSLSLEIEMAKIRLREAELTNDILLIQDEANRLNTLVSRWIFSRYQ